MSSRSIAEEWLDDPTTLREAPHTAFEGGGDYLDAATVALTFASRRLGRWDPSDAVVTSPVTPAALRTAMGCMATGVCVLTTVWDGDDVAMTANSVTSVSLDPPLLLVCVDNAATFHNAITAATTWGISILDASAHDVSSACARPGRDRVGQLTAIGHHRGSTGVALLDASVATFECVTEAIHPGGDHSIVVGRVVGVARRGDADHPLLFHQGRYRWL